LSGQPLCKCLADSYGNGNAYCNSDCDGNCHGDRNSHTHADGNANTDTAVRRKMQPDAAASPDSSASPVVLVVASLCEAQT